MRVACLLAGLLALPVPVADATGTEALYRLPWPEGLSFMFTQVADGRITTHFTKSTLHAVDIAMPVGVPVLAARAGVIAAVESGQGLQEEPSTYEGNFVRVRHDDATVATYAHLMAGSIVVAPGDAVRAGQLVALSGASGDVLKPHLHFAVIRAQKNAAGWTEEVSVPVRFYVGVPPIAFAPRAAMTARANYSSAADMPRTALEAAPLVPWKLPALAPGDEPLAWLRLALWLAAGVAGMAWFWFFSRKP